MTYIVELRYFSGNLADAMIEMRRWLDRNSIDAERFDCCSGCPGLAFRVGFSNGEQAAAFAAAFGGWVQGTDPRGPARRWTRAPSAAEIDGAAGLESRGQSHRTTSQSRRMASGQEMAAAPVISVAA